LSNATWHSKVPQKLVYFKIIIGLVRSILYFYPIVILKGTSISKNTSRT
jgi:hypothetical protein